MLLEVNGWYIRLEDAGHVIQITRGSAKKFECAGPNFDYDPTIIVLRPLDEE